MNEQLLNKYANLVVRKGINLQENQTIIINAPIEAAPFARLIAETAYKQGARDVIIDWNDELFSRIRFLNAPEEVFDEYPHWKKEMLLYNLKKGAAIINIAASDPEIFKGVDAERLARTRKASGIALEEYRERIMTNKNSWTIVSIPTKAWALKVFPDLNEELAVERLWDVIFKVVRIDTPDPVAAWTEHSNNLKGRLEVLNSKKFKYLHYKNSLGTDLTIELTDKHVWLGGAEKNAEGIDFHANMPTEEVFTYPKKTGVNGKVFSAMPLNYNGNIIDKFSLTFKDGKVIEYSAEVGHEVLKGLIETDEGSHYLGEVALVPYDSPISNLGILFYNTLFDENASCHLAIGKAYGICIEGGENMNKEELEKAEANDSITHIDFMIGTKDLEIMGVTEDGKEVPVFINGNFAF